MLLLLLLFFYLLFFSLLNPLSIFQSSSSSCTCSNKWHKWKERERERVKRNLLFLFKFRSLSFFFGATLVLVSSSLIWILLGHINIFSKYILLIMKRNFVVFFIFLLSKIILFTIWKNPCKHNTHTHTNAALFLPLTFACGANTEPYKYLLASFCLGLLVFQNFRFAWVPSIS